MKNNLIIAVLLALIIGGGVGFFGGMQYQKSQRGNLTNSQFGRNGQSGFRNGQRPVAGQIVSQDDKSITIKLQDGSSKIILLSSKTTINKATTGSKSDLKSGEQVSVFGTANSDGSVTAASIQLGRFGGRSPSEVSPTPSQ